jgi:hypothetical protein
VFVSLCQKTLNMSIERWQASHPFHEVGLPMED